VYEIGDSVLHEVLKQSGKVCSVKIEQEHGRYVLMYLIEYEDGRRYWEYEYHLKRCAK
jgi:hypothetical protein